MALKAKNDIIWGGKKFKAGEALSIPEDIAKLFESLGWCEAEEEVPQKKTKKK